MATLLIEFFFKKIEREMHVDYYCNIVTWKDYFINACTTAFAFNAFKSL